MRKNFVDENLIYKKNNQGVIVPISNTQLADALEVSCEYATMHSKKDPAGLINLAYLAAIALRQTEEMDENAPEEFISGEPSGESAYQWGETVQLENTTEVIRCHERADCRRDYCSIHNPREHHMRGWPQHFREDTGVMERICPHGVGHPDFDNPFEGDDPRWVHGCDINPDTGTGCCVAPEGFGISEESEEDEITILRGLKKTHKEIIEALEEEVAAAYVEISSLREQR